MPYDSRRRNIDGERHASSKSATGPAGPFHRGGLALLDIGDRWPTPRGVLFDLDGTLADTLPDLTAAVDETMRALGLRPCGLERVRDWVGGGVPQLVASALRQGLGREPTRPELERGLSVFLDSYTRHNGRGARPYVDVVETLQRLHSAKRPTACVTNKSSRFTLPLLAQLGLTELFDAIVCGDDPQMRKPHAEPLHEAARQLRLPVEDLLLVGDSQYDVTAARRAGMRVVVVSYGYSDCDSLAADGVIASLLELFERFPDLERPTTARPGAADRV